TYFPRFYAWVRWLPIMFITTSLANLLIDYFSGNYWLTGVIHYIETPVVVTFITAAIYTCWRHLSPARRFLGYGIILCGLAGIFVSTNAILHHEQALTSSGVIADCLILVVVLLFTMGLKEE